MVKLIAILLLTSSSVLAQTATGNDAADQAIAKASTAAQNAKDVRDKAIADANDVFAKTMVVIKQNELKDLKPCQLLVMQAGNLDAANAIQAAIDAVSKELVEFKASSMFVKNAVYVLYAAGSMVGGQDEVAKDQLKKMVSQLDHTQEFDLVVAQHNDAKSTDFIKLFPTMMNASDQNKQTFVNFLDSRLTFHGSVYLTPALNAAWGLPEKPAAVFFIINSAAMSGDPQEFSMVRTAVAENKQRGIPLNILLVEPTRRPLDPSTAKALSDLAATSGGMVQHIPMN